MLTLLVLLVLLACTSDAEKTTDSDSAPIIPDAERGFDYGLRCPIAEDGEECYKMRSDWEFDVGNPGEVFSQPEPVSCDPAVTAFDASASIRGTDDEGVTAVTVYMTFSCGEAIPAAGEVFGEDLVIRGDEGAVLLIHVTGEME